MAKEYFDLTNNHIRLIENMRFDFNDIEFGAPCVDPKRPYGNSYIYEDMASILAIDPDFVNPDDPSDILFSIEDIDLMDKLHKETETALQVIVVTKSFEPGLYVSDKYRNNWIKSKK